MRTKNNELDVKRLAEKYFGLQISRVQIRKFIIKYNDGKQKITKCIDEIINEPSDFLKLIFESSEIKLTNYEYKRRY